MNNKTKFRPTDISIGSVDLLCTWFATCFNKVEWLASHPILGEVPICNSCKNLIEKLEN